MTSKIAPCIWMDTEAEEAAEFYVATFRNTKVTDVMHYPDSVPGQGGTVLQVELDLDGQPLTLLNGGPGHQLTDALSLEVRCEDQAEVDELWERLTEGGQEVACGWLTDKYGVSWQIVPKGFVDVMRDPDPAAVQRAFDAMMQMKKLDLAALQAAARG